MDIPEILSNYSTTAGSGAAVSVGKPFEPGIIPLQQKSEPSPRSQETKMTRGPSSYVQQIFWQNWFFRACAFAIRIPFVSADTGDDFSNNLATDLAPILSLFGEQVTKQYMSQSMTWWEDIIFGMAPLGILTAMVGAIRVGGPTWMKAVVGRAQEGKGIVEMELMSSTSPDVCEMFDGKRVIRVLGSPSLAQLFYFDGDSTRPALERVGNSTQPALDRDRIYDLNYAITTGVFCGDTQDPELKKVPNPPNPPNLALNLSGHIVPTWELVVVAIFSTALQLSVIGFALRSGVYRKEPFEKDGKPPQKYATPCMASGTVALVIGMILCSHLIQQSTDEQNLEFIDRDQMKVAWLQRGCVVNDQQFDSYIIYRRSAHPLRISRRAGGDESRSLTLLAITLSLIGFFVQFVGLRGLNWSVTVAQLVSVMIMTLFRAIIRRNMAYNIRCVKGESNHDPDEAAWCVKIESNHELDTAARRIKNCSHWNIVTIPTSGQSTGESLSQPTTAGNSNALASSNQSTGLANKVFTARCDLEAFCLWDFQWQTTVDLIAEAIDSTMNFISTSTDVKKVGFGKVFWWKLSIQVQRAFVWGPWSGLLESRQGSDPCGPWAMDAAFQIGI